MTLRPLFIQAAWTTFKCLRPNASSENAKEHLIGKLARRAYNAAAWALAFSGYIHNLFGDLLADNHRQ